MRVLYGCASSSCVCADWTCKSQYNSDQHISPRSAASAHSASHLRQFLCLLHTFYHCGPNIVTTAPSRSSEPALQLNRFLSLILGGDTVARVWNRDEIGRVGCCWNGGQDWRAFLPPPLPISSAVHTWEGPLSASALLAPLSC